MTTRGDEIIRYVFETSGSKELQEAARVLLATGDASEEVEANLRGLADEFGKLAQEANQAKSLQSASAQFKDLARSVLEMQQRIDASKAKVGELGKALSATAEPTRKQVAEFERARNELQRLEQAQERQRSKLRDMRASFDEAGLSTRNLVAAEKELQARVSGTEQAMASVVTAARNAALARQQAAQAEAEALRQAAAAEEARARAATEASQRVAQAERVALDAIRNSAAQQQRALTATQNLQRAREILAQRAQEGSASERAYAQSLGASAAKIAAIGAAALGINSAVGLARDGLSQLIETAGRFQQLDVQLGAVFKDQADEASDAIHKLAQDTPYQLSQISDAFVKLKAFGLDPLDGSYQAIADQAAKLGGSQETLTGITLALGQAWAKQKLQGEEILQMVERGVPVWDLLQRATGKNVQELQKLSEAGKLGRSEIKLLIQEIGNSAQGASAALAGTLPGQINRLKSQWQEFLNTVANSGVLEYLQRQLSEVSAEVARMTATGELQAWAQSVSDAIVGAATAIKGVTGFLLEHRDAILALAEAYAAAKVVTLFEAMIGKLGRLAGILPVVNAGTAAAGGGIASLVSPLAATAAAAAFTFGQLGELVDALHDLDRANADARAAQSDLARQTSDFAASGKSLRDEFAAFASTAIASTQDLASKSREGLQSYISGLQGAIEYQRGLGKEAIAAGDSVARIAAQSRIVELRDGISAARDQLKLLDDTARLSLARVGDAGAKAAATYDDLIAKGKSAREAVSKLFDDLNLTDARGLQRAADIVAQVGIRGKEAGAAIRDELRKQILELSDQDFARFRAASLAAMRDAKFGATDLARAMEGINLARLGVDIEQIRTGFSAAGKGAAEAFRGAIVEIDNLGLTAAQRADAVGQAFDAAFGRAKTKADLEALKKLLQDAFAAGDIGADAFQARMDEIGQKIASLASATQKTPPIKPPDTSAYRAEIDGAAKYAGDAAEQMLSDQQRITEAQQQTSGALGGSIEALAQNMTRFAAVSETAALEYSRLVEALYKGAAAFSMQAAADGTGIIRFGEAVAMAARMTEEAIQQQRESVASLVASWGKLSDEQIAQMSISMGGIEKVTESLRAQAQAAREGHSQLELLGSADLAPLAAALDGAAAKVEQLRERTEAAKQSFEEYAASAREQIAQLNGDMDGAEQLRFERELERLKAQAEATSSLQSQEYQEAVKAATQLHGIKMAQIRKEADERKRADEEAAAREAQKKESSSRGSSGNGGDSGASDGGLRAGGDGKLEITLNGKDFGGVNPNDAAGIERLAKSLLPEIMRQIKRSASLTGRGI